MKGGSGKAEKRKSGKRKSGEMEGGNGQAGLNRPVAMPKLRIAIFAALAVVVVCIAVVVGTAKRDPALTARVVEVNKEDGGLNVV